MTDFNKKNNTESGNNTKDNTNSNNTQKDSIRDFIMRVVMDSDFKQLLIEDPDKAMAEFDLSDMQRMLIKSLDPQDIDMLTPDNVEEFFSADSAVYTPDIATEDDEENNADEDDI